MSKDDTWADEELRSITSCCKDYMDVDSDGRLICRSCKAIQDVELEEPLNTSFW